MVKAVPRFPELSTERLHLRRVEPRDAAGLHACFGDAEAMRYWNFPPSASLADTEKMIGWLGKTSSPYDHFAWALADKASDQCIGIVNYHHREARNNRLEIGSIIAPKHQRQGLATEALGSLIGYGTDELRVHRFQAFIDPRNIASTRLVARLGFVCEGGPLTDYWCVGGNYASVMIYARVGAGRAST